MDFCKKSDDGEEGGREMNCREFTTPARGIEPRGKKDLRLESIFHRRMCESYEPVT